MPTIHAAPPTRRRMLGLAVFGLSSVSALSHASGAVLLHGDRSRLSRSASAKLADYKVDARDYQVTGSGDEASKLQAAWSEALSSGRELHIPPYAVRADTSPFTLTVDQYLAYLTTFGRLPVIRGTYGKSEIDSRIANGWAIDWSAASTFGTPKGAIGGIIEGFTIRQGAKAVGSGGIRLRSAVNTQVRGIDAYDLSGTFFKLQCEAGDNDASNMVSLEDVRLYNIGGWGVDPGADGANSENSFVTLDRVFAQNCGTDESKVITGITKTNPAVVTVAGHGFANGAKVYIGGVVGMGEVNTGVSGFYYTVAGATTDTFQLSGLNSSGFNAYVSGGRAYPVEAQSGGLRIKNQTISVRDSAFVLCKNRSIYLPSGAAPSKDVNFYAVTVEHPQLIGVHVRGSLGMLTKGIDIRFNPASAGGPLYHAWLNDGTDGPVINQKTEGVSVSVEAQVGLTAFMNMGANVDLNTVRVDTATTRFEKFDHPGQVRFVNWQFDPIPDQGILTVASPTSLVYRPDPYTGTGRTIPIRRRYNPGNPRDLSTTGEWAAYQLSAAGVSRSNAGLGNSILYYVYVEAGAAFNHTPMIDVSSVAPAQDTASGYMVKPDEPWRRFVGRVLTTADGQFDMDAPWVNPMRIPGAQAGVPAWLWADEAAVRVKAGFVMPTGPTDYTY